MRAVSVFDVWKGAAAALYSLLLCANTAGATDWPQFRGPATDSSTPDAMAVNWPASGPTVVWTNAALTNGFSCLAVTGSRAFAMISKSADGVNYTEYCVGIDAATGATLWATPIDVAPWDPTYSGDGGSGAPPYYTGDGPRTTPSVAGGRVIALSGLMHLVCVNATNGSVLWSNNLPAAFGASTIAWENAASPCLDNDLVFVNLNSSFNNQNLAAFRVADGSLAWSGQNENVTHATPIVTTIQGVRQVVFATQTGLVSLDRSTGALLWKYTYPFFPISTSMGAGPVVYSNIVFCTAAYGRGAAAVQVTLTGGTWSVQQLFYNTGPNYRSIWMSPVCYQGYIYMFSGENSTFLTAPLNCIELSTGHLMWTTNNFGMGGLILVNTNLLMLSERGELILAQPSPTRYLELARYQAFHFSADAPGKCWVHPTFSNGRIYARSTRGAISLDASVAAAAPPLKLLAPQLLSSTQLQLTVATADGTPLNSNRVPRIEVRSTNAPTAAVATWPKLTNPLVLGLDGVARLTNAIAPGQSNQFYNAIEHP